MIKSFKWEFQNTKIPSADDMYWLIKLFVWSCPILGVSAKTKTLADYGWKAGSINTLRSEIKRQSSLTSDTFKTLHKVEELDSKLKELNVFDSYDLTKEFAICYAGGKTDTEAFFYMIRNAIAHGSFCVRSRNGERFYVFESKKKDSLRGRSVLKLKTIKRIQYILRHPDKYLNR